MSFLRASVDVEFCQTCSLTIGSSVEGAAAARALARVVGILSVLRVIHQQMHVLCKDTRGVEGHPDVPPARDCV